jgi:hypothetical protein
LRRSLCGSGVRRPVCGRSVVLRSGARGMLRSVELLRQQL